MSQMRIMLALAPEGPRIEFGVYTGATLALISDHAGMTIGVDTFAGMPEPTERDIKDGWNPYPKGRLAGSMRDATRAAPYARLIKGCVPDILAEIDVTGLAFAHLDMDHYHSTLAALEWIWPRMRVGGVIYCDDWFADRDWLAGGAINEFARKVGPMTGTLGRKAWWVMECE